MVWYRVYIQRYINSRPRMVFSSSDEERAKRRMAELKAKLPNVQVYIVKVMIGEDV